MAERAGNAQNWVNGAHLSFTVGSFRSFYEHCWIWREKYPVKWLPENWIDQTKNRKFHRGFLKNRNSGKNRKIYISDYAWVCCYLCVYILKLLYFWSDTCQRIYPANRHRRSLAPTPVYCRHKSLMRTQWNVQRSTVVFGLSNLFSIRLTADQFSCRKAFIFSNKY